VSNEDRPEFRALAELERVLEHVQEELASFRRRAQKAELDRDEMGIDHDVVASRETITELERDNLDKNDRLGMARVRVDGLLARLKFLEEQVGMDEQSQ
jgi:uncharacterized protein involved in exopolysaccharide biosynthesis